MSGSTHHTYVRLPKEMSAEAVADAVEEFFRRGGAETTHRAVGEPAADAPFGVVVSAAARGWIAVVDSEGSGSSPFGVFLARHLGTRVQVDALDEEGEVETSAFGAGSKVPSNFAHIKLEHAQAVAEPKGHTFLAFSKTQREIAEPLTLDTRLLQLVGQILEGASYELGEEDGRKLVRVTMSGGARQLSFITPEQATALAQLLDEKK